MTTHLKDFYMSYPDRFIEETLDVELYWYQKVLLRLLFMNTSKDKGDFMVVMIINNEVYIDGNKVPDVSKSKRGANITTTDSKVYVNGYEYKNGKWKRTLGALFHYLF